uniref:J domain-containing protein n=1 Tax=Peronospora matthiolae TaxID=2874970 RepID=A0AAV1UUB7_9STRA
MAAHDRTHLQPNHYDVLGVDRSASADDIKVAYRKLVLEHHPDRSNIKKSTSSSQRQDGKNAQILRINAAYDLLSDDVARVKYDMDMFGISAASNEDKATQEALHLAGKYKPMSSQDVHEMFGGLNSYERFTTAQFHRLRSHVAPAAIGRRATNLMERKRFRAANSKLPTQATTLAWLAFPIALAALWGVNVSNIKEQCKKR